MRIGDRGSVGPGARDWGLGATMRGAMNVYAVIKVLGLIQHDQGEWALATPA